MTTAYSIRQATTDDAAMIAHQRAGMFTDMGIDPALVQARHAAFLDWVSARLASGEYRGWLAVDEAGEVIAGVGLWLYEWVPSPLAEDLTRAYILNVYTERPYRQQGIARHLVQTLLDDCRQQGLKLALLHASPQGRPIYESLGFTQTNEMRLTL